MMPVKQPLPIVCIAQGSKGIFFPIDYRVYALEADGKSKNDPCARCS
jgi:hypothetical protein